LALKRCFLQRCGGKNAEAGARQAGPCHRRAAVLRWADPLWGSGLLASNRTEDIVGRPETAWGPSFAEIARQLPSGAAPQASVACPPLEAGNGLGKLGRKRWQAWLVSGMRSSQTWAAPSSEAGTEPAWGEANQAFPTPSDEPCSPPAVLSQPHHPNWVDDRTPLGWLIRRVLGSGAPAANLLFLQGAADDVIPHAERRGIPWRAAATRCSARPNPLAGSEHQRRRSHPRLLRARFHAYADATSAGPPACEGRGKPPPRWRCRVWKEGKH